MVDRIINEVYDPLPTLSSTNETVGSADYYYHFKTAEVVEIKSAAGITKDEEYRVWNPYQVMIGDVSWRIEQLTQSQLVLIWDRNDAAQYKRFVTKIYMKK